jgi:hypothetical protein
MAIDWVSLDVGETLVDETHQWVSLADWLAVSRLIFAAARGITCQRAFAVLAWQLFARVFRCAVSTRSAR